MRNYRIIISPNGLSFPNEIGETNIVQSSVGVVSSLPDGHDYRLLPLIFVADSFFLLSYLTVSVNAVPPLICAGLKCGD